MPDVSQILAVSASAVALGACISTIVATVKWAIAERALARTKSELQVARTDQAAAVAVRDQERSERALERQRAQEQIAALVADLESERAELEKNTTPDAAARRLADQLRRAREILGGLAPARGGAPGLPGDGSGPAGPAA
jgi:hypothetical protein